MNKIHYAYINIIRNRRTYLVFIIQMIVVFLILPESISSIISLRSGINSVKELCNDSVYIMRDGSSKEKLSLMVENREENVIKLNSVYNSIFSNNKDSYTVIGYDTGHEINDILTFQKDVTENFFSQYNIKLEKGIDFIQYNSNNQNQTYVPIVIGYNLAENFKVGEIYKFPQGGTGNELDCVVIGVLEYDATYPDIYQAGTYINLNDCYVFDLDYLAQNDLLGITDYYMAISSGVLITNNNSEAEIIQEELINTNVFDARLEKYDNFLEDYVKYIKEQINYKLCISGIVFIFSIIGLISEILILIDTNLKEYGIYIICGARIQDIILNFCFQICFIMIWPIIFSSIIYHDFNILLISIGLAMCVIFTLMIVPIIKFKMYSIPQLVRRSE